MRKLLKFTSTVLAVTIVGTCFSLIGCGTTNEKKYNLSINGSELLYAKTADSYKAGDEVSVKVKITPYEGVKALLDGEALVKTKSSQNDYWTFTFEMPAHDATLDLSSFTGFEEPFLYGLHITFVDKDGNGIEEFNKDLQSKDAIADYFVTYYDDNGVKVFSNNIGANVFAEGKNSLSNINGIGLESNLYFTYELLDCVATVNWVYYNEKTDEFFTQRGSGCHLDDVGYFSTFNDQHLSDTRYDNLLNEYEQTFDSKVTLHLKYIDYLTGVKIFEYNEDNELIGSNAIDKDIYGYVPSEESAYVVIEEEYTVMNDGEHNGETYYERTLINKTYYGDGKTLKYPRGDGLISPVYLNVNWFHPDMDEESTLN